jgi:hypothetical protein
LCRSRVLAAVDTIFAVQVPEGVDNLSAPDGALSDLHSGKMNSCFLYAVINL